MAGKKGASAGAKVKSVTQPVVNIGMIGHVDHGKTSLTKALTGKWTDTHSEELKRGISIRLGYADAEFYKCSECKGGEAFSPVEKCPNCGKKGKLQRKVSFIDAPGHETLMMTMLSGAALMQGAVLVIAANEKCPQPRTSEHLMALSIAGVKEIVVAQNKVDLVSKDKAVENYKQIQGFLKEFGYENAAIIPTAANFGTNLDLLIEAVEEKIDTPKFDNSKPLKMFVVRSFDINKPGAKARELVGGVLGGSIIQGELRKGAEIEIVPGIAGEKMKAKCVSLSVADGELESAVPGGLIAVGTELDPSVARNDRLRGQMVAKPGVMPEATTKMVSEVHKVKRMLREKVEDIKTNEPVVITVGTMTVLGNVVKKLKGDDYEFELKARVSVEKGQKVAISKKEQAQWRLVAYGVVK